eukprot:TRINITY_DN5381_c0_g2_i1.p1 TRINITY_DN5381_c0_g2~~TRINITY_DN5381_c0_g2_i1.p1  ORF type:complete len:188 (-),score=7.33 TRINITY_DN5381_c0_g2_i1:158-721(-)
MATEKPEVNSNPDGAASLHRTRSLILDPTGSSSTDYGALAPMAERRACSKRELSRPATSAISVHDGEPPTSDVLDNVVIPVSPEVPLPRFVQQDLADVQILHTTCFESAGTRLHAQNRCVPCKFFRTRGGCRNGAACHFCHEPHTEMTTSQVKRNYREYLMSFVVNKEVLKERGKIRGPPYGLILRF